MISKELENKLILLGKNYPGISEELMKRIEFFAIQINENPKEFDNKLIALMGAFSNEIDEADMVQLKKQIGEI
ncbi:MAG: hypothetical protein WCP14_00290 [bacterium]